MLRMDNLDSAIARASANRSRLVFLSAGLFDISGSEEVTDININKALSDLLIKVPRSERPKSVGRMVRNLIGDAPSAVVKLTGLEILFDRSLETDPVRLLSACATHKTLLVYWPGNITKTGLTYAVPSHPEYRNYRASELSEVILLEN